jgi:microcystin-dependent protein
MPKFNFSTPSGEQAFERWVMTTIRNEVNSYTRTALAQSLGGEKSTKNSLDNTNLSIIPIGGIIPFGGINLPDQFLWCDGSLVDKSKYRRLYNVLGINRYCTDTSSQFYLPDLKSRFIVGAANVNANVISNSVVANVNTANALTNHSHNTNVGHYHNTGAPNANADGAHSHTFQGATASIARAAGNQAGLAAATHNHAWNNHPGHGHGVNATNTTGARTGGSPNVDVNAFGSSNVDLTHAHSLSIAGIPSSTVNFIIKF